MSTVVLRLIGDEWKYEEKIAISVPAQAALKMSTSNFAKRLQVPSWNGLTLYYTEGKYPNKIRPTVPISLETNPQREKFTNGSILWVKVQADLKEQEADRRFHESLVIWRKENNIPGILSDGSDVSDFLYEYLSHLNAEDTRDISSHEAEKRALVEGEEHRGFWTLTFEYHEIQDMKDDEARKRQQLEEDWIDGALAVYKATVRNPLAELRRREVINLEDMSRSKVVDEATAEYGSISSEYRTAVEGIARAEQLAKAAATVGHAAAPTSSVLPTSRQVSVVTGSSAGGAGFVPADIDAIVAAITSKISVAQQSSIDEARRATEQLEIKLLNAVREVRQESSDLRGAVQQILKDHQVVAQSIQENVKLSSERLHEDRLELIETHMSSVAKELDEVFNTSATAWAVHGSEEIDQGVKLLEEQRDLLQNIITTVAKEQAEKEAMEKSVEAAALRHVLTSALQSQSLLNESVQRLEGELAAVSEQSEVIRRANVELIEALHSETARSAQRERSLLEAAEKIAEFEGHVAAATQTKISTVGRFHRDSVSRAATLGLHPDLFRVIFMLLEQRLPLPRQFIEATGVQLPPSGNLAELDTGVLMWLDNALRAMPEVHDYLREQVVDLVLDCGSPHQICDELCFRLSITSHPYRKLFARHTEQFAPHMHAAVDILLELYRGREVELFCNIAGVRCSRETCSVYRDSETGKQYYYCQLFSGVTQWLEPHDF